MGAMDSSPSSRGLTSCRFGRGICRHIWVVGGWDGRQGREIVDPFNVEEGCHTCGRDYRTGTGMAE